MTDEEFLNEVVASVYKLRVLLGTKLTIPPDLAETLEQIKYFAITEVSKINYAKRKENKDTDRST